MDGEESEYKINFSTLESEIIDMKKPEIEQVEITSGFWKDKIDLFRSTTINYAFDKYEATGTLKNFEKISTAGARPEGQTDPWNDGLLYEMIRAAADFIRSEPDAALKTRVNGYIDIIYNASMKSSNGYLSTWAMMEKPGKYFDETGNARWYHDSYNFGCLVEAAVHYYKATGDTKLLYIATRFAEFVVDNYGYGKINMVPSHEGPEEMLLKLYQLYRDNPSLKTAIENYNPADTLDINENDYADLVMFWIENRGNYNGRTDNANYGVYAQDHDRYYNQTAAAGHAVRANLFYTGIAAAGLEFKNNSYLSAAEILFNNIVNKQMYITGGTGSTSDEEAYTVDYDLPLDGYCETCAQSAMGFFSENMLLAFGDSKYADVIEKEMYNGILGCTSLDGKSFYYVQPLTGKNASRWDWLEHTPCCPPMYMKFFSELGTYIYSYTDTELYVNQFISSNLDIGSIKVKQESNLPWYGNSTVTIEKGNSTLHIRIPEWAETVEIKVNATSVNFTVKNGYAVLSVNQGDVVKVVFPMEAKRVYDNENVNASKDMVALKYGPVVFCFEQVDNKLIPNYNQSEFCFSIPKNAELKVDFENILGGIQTITAEAEYYSSNGGLMTTKVKAIPFYARANRGKSTSYVFVGENLTNPSGNYKYWI